MACSSKENSTTILIYFFFNGDLFINRINSIPKLVQCRAAGTIFFCSLLPWGDLPGAFLLENLVATARTSSGVGGVWARARAAPSYRPEQQPNCSEFGIRTPSLLSKKKKKLEVLLIMPFFLLHVQK